jgi:hypothetical protein
VTQDPDKQPKDPDRDGPDLEKSSIGPDGPVEVPSDLSGMPSLAELDAMDLAAIEAGRQSKDKDHAMLDEEIPPPAALYHAWLLWLGGASAGLVSVVFGFMNSGSISNLVNDRLQVDVARDPDAGAPADRIDSLASFFPPAMLVATLVLLVVQYPLLVATSRRRSRSARNLYVTTVLVMLLCIPIGIDLLFDYPSISGVIKFVGWLQFALLLLSALFTLRRGVNRWLPPAMR